MAFNLKSKFTSNGLIKSVKTGSSPFLQAEECLQYDVVNGERRCVKRKKTVSSESVPFSADPDEKAKQLQWIKNNPEKYKKAIDEKKNKTLISNRDVTSGETNIYPKDIYKRMQFYKKRGDLDGWKEFLNKNNIDNDDPDYRAHMKKMKNVYVERAQKEKNKEKRRAFCKRNPEECYKKNPSSTPPRNKNNNETIVTDDTLSEWTNWQ